MFKKLFKLTTLAFIGPTVGTFFVVVFVLLIQFLWKYIDDLVGKGLEWYVLLELMFYASSTFVPLALPLSILLSSVMTFGGLSERYELVALKSAGVSFWRTLRPMIVVVLLVATAGFFFSNNVIPRANLKFYSLLWDVRQKRPAFDLTPNIFYHDIENYSIRVRSKNDETNTLTGILIYDHTHGRGNDIVLMADSGKMIRSKDNKALAFELYSGVRYEEMENRGKFTHPHNRMRFASYHMQFDLSGFDLKRTQEELFKEHYHMLNINQLSFYQDSLRRRMGKLRQDVRSYSLPYFHLLKDTAFLEKYTPADTPATAFIENFNLNEKRRLTDRASVSARSLQETMRIQTDDLQLYQKLLARYTMEWHKKFALSLACLTLFFIGAPLGAIIRKGGFGLPVVVSLVMFIVFYVLTIVGEKSAKELALTPFVGIWAPTFILLPLGVALCHLTNRDRIGLSMHWPRRVYLWAINRAKRLRGNTATV